MNRRVLPIACGVVMAAALIAGCSSPGGSTPPPSRNTPTTSPSTPPAPTTSSKATAPPASPSWTPPNYGAAQAAVTAYLNLIAQYDKTFMDPSHSSASSFDQYVIGNAKTLFDASLYNEQKAGRYYKGTPALQRVRVASLELTHEPATVHLYSCPMESTADPWTEYDASGRPVPPTLVHGVAPPYGKKITMIRLSGQWKASEFATDTSKTCTP